MRTTALLLLLVLAPFTVRADRPDPEADYDRTARRAAPRDAFPVLNNPTMRAAGSLKGDELRDNEPVVGVSLGKQHKAYPLSVMGSHELVNDVCGKLPIAVSW